MFKSVFAMFKSYSFLGALLGMFLCQSSLAAPIHIVAAENFYGSVAKEIGGAYVRVESILQQPDQDPHLFNVSPSTAKSLAQADLIVFNGLGYDPWMQNLLSVGVFPSRTEICVGKLVNKKEGDNPHIWYDPATMPVYAKALLDYFDKKDPSHRANYQLNYQRFLKKNDDLTKLINQIKPYAKGIKVIATEPVFGYMAQALGFDMQGMAFQISMMNGVDPSPRQVQDFQKALQIHSVRILFYNKQVTNPLVQQLLKVAKTYAISVIGVTETQPLNTIYYNEWMEDQLNQLNKALDEQHRI
ncbi:MAG: zinc ABC transporter substrate-binding protein [Pseudomonadota bacterium]